MGSGKISINEVKKRHRQKHRDMGICIYCSKKAKENKKHCEYHLKKIKEYTDRHKEKIKLLNSQKETEASKNY